MKKKTIVFNGGLGNQLFQYAYMLYLNENKICLPLYNTSLYEKHTIHAGFEANKVFDFGSFQQDSRDYNTAYSIERRCEKLFRHHILFNDDAIARRRDIRPLIGYWQDIKYYQAVEDKLVRNFLGIDIFCKANQILEAAENTESVFIHVRRGDYCGNSNYQDLSSTQYYYQAISYMRKKLRNPSFFVLSDDIRWCKTYFPSDSMMHYVEYDGQNALGDLAIMLKCHNAIIANSSFSWWGTSLESKNIVIYPQRYYVNGSCQPLYQTDWVGIE